MSKQIQSNCDEDESLIQQCIEVIRSEQKASVSLLQRRLRLGYTRTARIMDELEFRGIVGPEKGCEPRDILIEIDREETAPLPQPTYIEQGDAMAAQAREAGVEIIKRNILFILDGVNIVRPKVIEIVQAAQEIGAQIELFTGHDKLLPAQFKPLEVALPNIGIDFARECVSAHQRNAEPITDYAQASVVFERLMVQLELLAKSKREKTEKPPVPKEPVKDWISDVIRAAQAGVRLFKDEGYLESVAREEPFLLVSFLKEYAPLEKLAAKAKELTREIE